MSQFLGAGILLLHLGNVLISNLSSPKTVSNLQTVPSPPATHPGVQILELSLHFSA